MPSPRDAAVIARKTFLREFASHGCVSLACKTAGRTTRWARYQRQKFPRFAAAWDEFQERHVDSVAQTLLIWARSGIKERTTETGEDGITVITRERLRYDPSITMFFLKKHRPEVYGDTIGEYAGDFADEVYYALAETAKRWGLESVIDEESADSPDEAQQAKDVAHKLMPSSTP